MALQLELETLRTQNIDTAGALAKSKAQLSELQTKLERVRANQEGQIGDR